MSSQRRQRCPQRQHRQQRQQRQRGAVVLEFAALLPVVAVIAMGTVWLTAAAMVQVRCIDAARAGVRAGLAAAQATQAAQLAHQAAAVAAPPGAQVSASLVSRTLTVTVRAMIKTPDIVPGLPHLAASQTAVAQLESA